MKIIQITTLTDRHDSIRIFGLGDNGYPYEWNYSKGEWKDYWKNEDAKPAAVFIPHQPNHPRNSTR